MAVPLRSRAAARARLARVPAALSPSLVVRLLLAALAAMLHWLAARVKALVLAALSSWRAALLALPTWLAGLSRSQAVLVAALVPVERRPLRVASLALERLVTVARSALLAVLRLQRLVLVVRLQLLAA